MFQFLSGKLLKKDAKAIVLGVGGIGFRVGLTESDLSKLPVLGSALELHVHTFLREDAIGLYGFMAEADLTLFEELIQVSGIGPKVALALLSGMAASDIQRAIIFSDVKALTKIPGVGKKTAERMVFELKDRLSKVGLPHESSSFAPHTLDDLKSALGHLGYRSHNIEKALVHMSEHVKSGALSLEKLVEQALKYVD